MLEKPISPYVLGVDITALTRHSIGVEPTCRTFASIG